MREKLARGVALLTMGGLVALSLIFARAQNAPAARGDEPRAETRQDPAPQEQPPIDALRARALFEEHGCAACHAVGGVGNPRNPLDGVGARRTPASIRAWTIGESSVADSLSTAALRVKSTYVDLPEADLELIVRWLAALGRE